MKTITAIEWGPDRNYTRIEVPFPDTPEERAALKSLRQNKPELESKEPEQIKVEE